MAAHALGTFRGGDAVRTAVSAFARTLDFERTYTRCDRFLQWAPVDDGECDSEDMDPGFDGRARDIPLGETFSGFGEVVQRVAVEALLGGCRVSLEAHVAGYVDECAAGSTEQGEVVACLDPRGPPVQLLTWRVSDDHEDEAGPVYSCDACALMRLASRLFPPARAGAAPLLAVEEMVQFLARILCSPFRWLEVVHPYVEDSCVYRLLYSRFMRCVATASEVVQVNMADFEHMRDRNDLRRQDIRARGVPAPSRPRRKPAAARGYVKGRRA